MSKSEFNKVFLTGCLLLIICVGEIIDNAWFTTLISENGLKIPYPYYDYVSKSFSLTPEKLYYRKFMWWVQDLADVTIPVILMLILIIKPDMKRFGFNMWYPWLFYFSLTAFNRVTAIGKIPFGWIMEVFILGVQAAYTIRCYELNQENR